MARRLWIPVVAVAVLAGHLHQHDGLWRAPTIGFTTVQPAVKVEFQLNLAPA